LLIIGKPHRLDLIAKTGTNQPTMQSIFLSEQTRQTATHQRTQNENQQQQSDRIQNNLKKHHSTP